MLAGTWRNQNLSHCWQEGKKVRPLWKTIQQFLRKAKYRVTIWPSNFILKCKIPEIIKNICLHEAPHMMFIEILLVKSPRVETTQTSNNWCMGEQNPHRRILFSHKKGIKFWHMLQPRWTLKTLCWVQEARHDRPAIVCFCLYELSRIDKSIERANGLVVTRAGGGRGIASEWPLTTVETFGSDRNILELDSGYHCTTL